MRSGVVLAQRRGFEVDLERVRGAGTGGRTGQGRPDHRTALRAELRRDIPLRMVEAHVNDPAFGQAAAGAFLELVRG